MSSSSGSSSTPWDVLSVAPMIQWTDRHWRYYMRCLTKQTVLYTEMIMDNAIIYNPTRLDTFLGHHAVEEPMIVQLGGNDPERLAQAAALCEQFGGFREINLNSGCPSNKAKKAGFGAELMLEPELIRRITYEMKRRVTKTDITVKCRIGVTGKESWEDLVHYVANCKQSGIEKMIIHARSCVLKGLTPAQNRTIPPLHPELVHKLVKTFPDMKFILNGGIADFTTAKYHVGMLPHPNEQRYYAGEDEDFYPVHGVMIGREAYNNPFLFQTADEEFFGANPADQLYMTRAEVIEQYLDYAEDAQSKDVYGNRTCTIVKPLHNIFHGCVENQKYKQKLNQLLIDYSRKIEQGEMKLSEMIHEALEETIPSDFLHGRYRAGAAEVMAAASTAEEVDCPGPACGEAPAADPC